MVGDGIMYRPGRNGPLGPEWTALCQNGPIRPEGAVWARNGHFGQNGPNGPIGPEWSGLIRMDRFGQNGPFGPDWPDRARMGRLEQNGPFRPGLVQTWPRTGPILGPKPAPIIREYGPPNQCTCAPTFGAKICPQMEQILGPKVGPFWDPIWARFGVISGPESVPVWGQFWGPF